MRAFTTLSAAAMMDAAELRSRCRAAARLAMTSKNYGPEDEADCAAMIAADVLGNRRRTGTAAEVLRHLDWADRYPATVWAMAAEGTEYIPRSAVEFSRLYGLASNYRRSLDRRRRRDAEDAAAAAARDSFLPHLPTEDVVTRGTPHAARRLAVDMLRDLGMLSGGNAARRDAVLGGLPAMHAHGPARDVLRYLDRAAAILDGNAWPVSWRPYLTDAAAAPAARAESPSGPVWTAAYAAARAASGLDAAEIAAELDISYGTLRNHLSAAAAKVPSVAHLPMHAHAAAIGTPEPAAHKATWTRNRSANLDTDWRTRPDAAAPIMLRTGETAAEMTPPDWTLDLAPNTSRRLAHGAQVKRTRMSAKTAAQRAADRLAAGIPA